MGVTAPPMAVITYEGELTKEQIEILKARWKKAYSGIGSAIKPEILHLGRISKPSQSVYDARPDNFGHFDKHDKDTKKGA